MFKKKMVLGAVTALLFASSMGNIANAEHGNISNTDYSFAVAPKGAGGGYFTQERGKEDATSTYVNITKMRSSQVLCRVWGNRYLGNGIRVWADEAIGVPKVTYGEQLIKQLVYEHGGNRAKLLFSQVADYSEIVSGKWSPDSIGSFRPAN